MKSSESKGLLRNHFGPVRPILPFATIFIFFWGTIAVTNTAARGSCSGTGAGQNNSTVNDVRHSFDRISTEELIRQLANRNKAPTEFKGAPPVAKFPADYDWKEQARVIDVAYELERRIDQALPDLLKHLDDEAYCLTYDRGAGAWRNYTVGTQCYRVATANLAPVAFHPDIVNLPTPWKDSRKGLTVWLSNRETYSLAELQLECLRFQRRYILKLGVPRDRVQTLRACLATIDSTILKIMSTRVPIKVATVFTECVEYKNYPFKNE